MPVGVYEGDATFSAQRTHHARAGLREHPFVPARKPITRKSARELRKQGMPIKRIAAKLRVSPSSVLDWTRDIRLSPQQRERNLRGPQGPQNPQVVRRRVEAIKRSSRARRRRYQEKGRGRARGDDGLHRSGCMLYWAEGSKDRNSVVFCNSDLNRVRFFKRFLEQCFAVPDDKFRLSLHVYLGNGLSLRQIERHWLNALHADRGIVYRRLLSTDRLDQ